MQLQSHRDICDIPIQVGDFVLFKGLIGQVELLHNGSSFSILKDYKSGYTSIGITSLCLKLTSEQCKQIMDNGD